MRPARRAGSVAMAKILKSSKDRKQRSEKSATRRSATDQSDALQVKEEDDAGPSNDDSSDGGVTLVRSMISTVDWNKRNEKEPESNQKEADGEEIKLDVDEHISEEEQSEGNASINSLTSHDLRNLDDMETALAAEEELNDRLALSFAQDDGDGSVTTHEEVQQDDLLFADYTPRKQIITELTKSAIPLLQTRLKRKKPLQRLNAEEKLLFEKFETAYDEAFQNQMYQSSFEDPQLYVEKSLINCALLLSMIQTTGGLGQDHIEQAGPAIAALLFSVQGLVTMSELQDLFDRLFTQQFVFAYRRANFHSETNGEVVEDWVTQMHLKIWETRHCFFGIFNEVGKQIVLSSLQKMRDLTARVDKDQKSNFDYNNPKHPIDWSRFGALRDLTLVLERIVFLSAKSLLEGKLIQPDGMSDNIAGDVISDNEALPPRNAKTAASVRINAQSTNPKIKNKTDKPIMVTESNLPIDNLVGSSSVTANHDKPSDTGTAPGYTKEGSNSNLDYVPEAGTEDHAIGSPQRRQESEEIVENIFANLPPVRRKRYGENLEDFKKLKSVSRNSSRNPRTPNAFERSGQSPFESSHTGSFSTKKRWTDEETACLAKAIKKLFNGGDNAHVKDKWKVIMERHGPNGTKSHILAGKTNMKLSDKAITLVNQMWVDGQDIEPYWHCVRPNAAAIAKAGRGPCHWKTWGK